jgi:hypothetical protein
MTNDLHYLQKIAIIDYLDLIKLGFNVHRRAFDEIKNYIIGNTTIWQIQAEMNNQTKFCEYLSTLTKN